MERRGPRAEEVQTSASDEGISGDWSLESITAEASSAVEEVLGLELLATEGGS